MLDLFAGTGALGIEAISRGAAHALFVETGVEGRGIIRTNIETLGLNGVTRILRRDATDLGRAGTIAPFDLVFCDPPYGKGLGEKALASAAAGGWLKPGALCVLEERGGREIELPPGFEVLERARAGDSQLDLLRALVSRAQKRRQAVCAAALPAARPETPEAPAARREAARFRLDREERQLVATRPPRRRRPG